MLEKIIIFILLGIILYEIVFDFARFYSTVSYIFSQILIEIIKTLNFIMKI